MASQVVLDAAWVGQKSTQQFKVLWEVLFRVVLHEWGTFTSCSRSTLRRSPQQFKVLQEVPFRVVQEDKNILKGTLVAFASRSRNTFERLLFNQCRKRREPKEFHKLFKMYLWYGRSLRSYLRRFRRFLQGSAGTIGHLKWYVSYFQAELDVALRGASLSRKRREPGLQPFKKG